VSGFRTSVVIVLLKVEVSLSVFGFRSGLALRSFFLSCFFVVFVRKKGFGRDIFYDIFFPKAHV
jgi:hypothetical protein